jgi:putative FmdB family regulatory protein
MPTYDYQCTQCGHLYEAFQAITAEPKSECPKCGAPAKRRIGTGVGLIFKGSGFYQTDYKRKDSPKGGDGKKTDSGASGESKPAGASVDKKD